MKYMTMKRAHLKHLLIRRENQIRITAIYV